MRNQASNCENQQFIDIYQCLKTQTEQLTQNKQKRCKNKLISLHSAEQNHSIDSHFIKPDSIQVNNLHCRGILQEIQNSPNKSQKIEKHLTTSPLLPQNNISQIIKPSQTLLYQPQFISKLPQQQNQKQAQQQQQQYFYQSQQQQFPQNAKSTLQAGQKKQSASKFKTEICKNWIKYGKCNYGQKCLFAHGKQDLNEKTQKVSRHYKAKLCEKFHTTSVCTYGSRCLFIHENRSVKEIKTFGFFQRRFNNFCQEYQLFMNSKNQTKINCLMAIPSRLPFFQSLAEHTSLILC